MKLKVLKIISIISESFGIGALALYAYNYFYLKSKYTTIPENMNNNIKIYLLIGIVLLAVYIIVKFMIYFVRKDLVRDNYEQLSINVDEKIVNIGNKYIVPIEKQMNCPNCNNIVDKNAFICLHCGYLLQSFGTPKLPKVEYKSYDMIGLYRLLLNILLVVFIFLVLLFGYNVLKDNTKIFDDNTKIESNSKTSFYNIASSIINEVNNKYKNSEIKLSRNTVYFKLSDLGYTSGDYDSNKSYIAINKTENQIYIALLGINSYEDYSINITEINDLDVTDVLTNTGIISELDGKLLLDNGNNVIIYYKN